jgi:hypothetical protein
VLVIPRTATNVVESARDAVPGLLPLWILVPRYRYRLIWLGDVEQFDPVRRGSPPPAGEVGEVAADV